MIYTSYFAKIRKLPDNIIPVSICGKAPEGYKGLQYKKLAPKYEFFKKWKENHNNEYYIRCFNEQVLANLNASEVVSELQRLVSEYNNDNVSICLVCYEKSTDFCHRHLVADWLRRNGFHCEEWTE